MSYGRSTWSGGVGAVAALGMSKAGSGPVGPLPTLPKPKRPGAARAAYNPGAQMIAPTTAPGFVNPNRTTGPSKSGVNPNRSAGYGGGGGTTVGIPKGWQPSGAKKTSAKTPSSDSTLPTTAVPVISVTPTTTWKPPAATAPPAEIFIDPEIDAEILPSEPKPGMSTKAKVGLGIAAGLGLLYFAFGQK